MFFLMHSLKEASLVCYRCVNYGSCCLLQQAECLSVCQLNSPRVPVCKDHKRACLYRYGEGAPSGNYKGEKKEAFHHLGISMFCPLKKELAGCDLMFCCRGLLGWGAVFIPPM